MVIVSILTALLACEVRLLVEVQDEDRLHLLSTVLAKCFVRTCGVLFQIPISSPLYSQGFLKITASNQQFFFSLNINKSIHNPDTAQ